MTHGDKYPSERPRPPEKKSWWIFLLIISAVAIVVSNFASSDKSLVSLPSSHRAEQTHYSMGTSVRILAEGIKAEDAVDAAMDEIRRLSHLFDPLDPAGEINELNFNGSSWTPLSLETIELIEKSVTIANTMESIFNPAIIHPFNLRHIDLDKVNNRARLLIEDQRVDIDVLAQGYAADRAVEILKRFEVERAVIDIGGTTTAIGFQNFEGDPWRIDLFHPVDDLALATVNISGSTIATSTGPHNIEVDLSSVSIVANSAIEANAYAIVVFVLGTEKGLTLLNQLSDIEGILLDTNNDVYITDALRHKVELK